MSRWYAAVRPLARAWSSSFKWMYPRGLGLPVGHAYLLLETKGRRSSRRRVTPLGYVKWKGRFLVQPLHGVDSDWVLNLQASPQVSVVVGRRRIRGRAMVLADVAERRAALQVIASSRTVSGLTARKHFSLLGKVSAAALELASRDPGKPIVIITKLAY